MAQGKTSEDALSLIHQGWDHLRHGRPIAARASPRRKVVWKTKLSRQPGTAIGESGCSAAVASLTAGSSE